MNNTSENTQDTDQDYITECGSKYFNDEEMASIEELTVKRSFKKGDILIKEGQVVDQCFHIIKGCLRQYRIVDGIERSIFFYTEDQSVLSVTHTSSIYLANYNVDCVEDTNVTIMSAPNERELYRRHPKMESMSRMSLEQMMKKYQEMLGDFMISSPEERYIQLLNERPDLLTRVPQYQLASYIGVKPESLSRIRKRILEKRQSKK